MNRYLRSMPATLLIAFTFIFSFTAGCSNDGTPTDNGGPGGPYSIEVSGILCNPLAPTPGNMARLTVRAAGQGAGATYEWQVEAGTIMPDTILNSEGKIARIDSTSISIRWKVPTEAGVYMATVRASVGSEVRMDTTWVMVRRCMAIDAGLRYAFYPTLVDGELFCVGADTTLFINSRLPGYPLLLGYHAYNLNNIPPTQIDRADTAEIGGGYDFKFYPDGLLTASITHGNLQFRQQPTNVILFPYIPTSPMFWSKNEKAGTTYRKNRNLHPSASSGLDMVVWQRTVAGASDDGKKDIVNIRFRFSTASAAPILTLTTAVDSVFQFGLWNYTYWRNIKPLFSPDDAMIIYFNDSTETFEPCLIPMDGTEPNLAEQRALMVDARHGIFFYAGVRVSEKTVFQWNPASPTQLAFIDDKLQFCIFDYVMGTVEVIATGLTEFVYSEDGTLAGVNEDGVFVLKPGQTQAKLVFAKERATDAVIGVNWSPGLVDQKLGFRMVRKGASTLESYAVLVIYSMDNDRWYYASPEIKPVMGTEPAVNYTWMRAIFDPFNGDMYVPVPISIWGGRTVIYHSY